MNIYIYIYIWLTASPSISLLTPGSSSGRKICCSLVRRPPRLGRCSRELKVEVASTSTGRARSAVAASCWTESWYCQPRKSQPGAGMESELTTGRCREIWGIWMILVKGGEQWWTMIINQYQYKYKGKYNMNININKQIIYIYICIYIIIYIYIIWH